MMLKVLPPDNLKQSAPDAAAPASLYERDFNLWIEEQARLLKESRFDLLDLENVIEELESMGRSQKTSLKSHFGNLLMHLMKYRSQPEQRSSSWRGSIREARKQIAFLLEDSPSLVPFLASYAAMAKVYKSAIIQAADETGLPASTFPPELPFTLEEMLDEDFWPE
jgi:ribosomal protein L29